MHELPAHPAAFHGSVIGNAVAYAGEFAQLLDVDLDQFTRLVALISYNRFRRFQIARSGP